MSKSACQTPCQLASCFFIFLTHSFFSFLSFSFFLIFLHFTKLVSLEIGAMCACKLSLHQIGLKGRIWFLKFLVHLFFLLLTRIKTIFITYKMIFATPKFVEAMCARGLSQIVANIGNLNETNFSNPCKLVLDHTTM